jgi:hypothetical protein
MITVSLLNGEDGSDNTQVVIHNVHSKLQFPSRDRSIRYSCNHSSNPVAEVPPLNSSLPKHFHTHVYINHFHVLGYSTLQFSVLILGHLYTSVMPIIQGQSMMYKVQWTELSINPPQHIRSACCLTWEDQPVTHMMSCLHAATLLPLSEAA